MFVCVFNHRVLSSYSNTFTSQKCDILKIEFHTLNKIKASHLHACAYVFSKWISRKILNDKVKKEIVYYQCIFSFNAISPKD